MSSVNLDTIYKVDATQAVAGIDALIGKLQALEVVADRVKPKLQGLAAGASAPMAAAGRAATSLTGNLNGVQAAATAAQAGIQANMTAVSAAAAQWQALAAQVR